MMSNVKIPIVPEIKQQVDVKNKTQIKTLSSDVTTNGAMSDLTFSGLIIDMWYEVDGSAYLAIDDGVANSLAQMVAIHNGGTLDSKLLNIRENTDTTADTAPTTFSFKFKAVASNLEFHAANLSAGASIRGDGTRSETYIQLTERKDLVETDQY